MNSQCISIGFVGGIARPPTLPTTHTLFLHEQFTCFLQRGMGRQRLFFKGNKTCSKQKQGLKQSDTNSCLLGSVLGSEQTAKCNPTCNMPKGMSERERGRTHTRAQRYKITCSSDCSKGIHCVLVLFCYIQEQVPNPVSLQPFTPAIKYYSRVKE